ncbi:hypothetical protein B0T17DRAFT_474943, partial [Bombardia bombarda]
LAATAIGPSLITAHMAMVTPAPFATPKVGPQNNSPLAADGTDFPCKAGPSDTYVPGTTPNNFPLGSEQPLVFVGSAVHGGGSCQISITYDNPPTAKSVWKVVTSIEGGCPARGEVGNLNIAGGASAPDPYTYNFTIPDNIPTGKATLAWTWFGKLGGRPEMYMNCAPVTLTAPGEASANGSSLTPRDDSGPMAVFESLPDMFVANIGNGCKSPESADTLFPNPGANLQQLNGDTTKFSTPIGTGCQQPTGSPPESPSSNNASSSAAITTSNSQSTSPSSSSTNAAAHSTPTALTPTLAPLPSPSLSPAAPPPALSLIVGAASTASSTDDSDTSSSTDSSITGAELMGACSDEGVYNCIDGDSYQTCSSGTWSIALYMDEGESCKVGQ